MKRWTIQQLTTWSDRELISGFLRDRAETCTNVYAPLYEKLTSMSNKLDRRANFNSDGNLEEAA